MFLISVGNGTAQESRMEYTEAGASGLAHSHLADHEAGSKGEHLAWAPIHKSLLASDSLLPVISIS